MNRSGYFVMVLILSICFLAGCEEPSRKASNSDAAQIELSEQMFIKDVLKEKGVRNIKIILDKLSVRQSEFGPLEKLWEQVDTDAAKPSNRKEFKKSGIRAGVVGEDFITQMDDIRKTLDDKIRRRDALIISNDESGYMNFAKGPDVSQFYYSGKWYNSSDYDLSKAPRSLRITARRLKSNKTLVEVSPLLYSFFKTQSPFGNNLNFIDAGFKAVVPDGKCIVIGRRTKGKNDLAEALFTGQGEFTKMETLLVITPYFMAHLRPPE